MKEVVVVMKTDNVDKWTYIDPEGNLRITKAYGSTREKQINGEERETTIRRVCIQEQRCANGEHCCVDKLLYG